MKLKGAEILLQCLQKEGVDTVFGYPGGAVLPIYDALYKSEIRHILSRHEQGAAHAADGYARATGRVGVCISTSGPGATNLVTGIATAYMDSIPLVCFTGQVGTSLIGRDAFQEADITGITLPITKHNYLVEKTDDLARIVKEAFYIARTNRPGPVVVDLPKDVMEKEIDFEYPEEAINIRGYRVVKGYNSGQVITAVDYIQKARRPVIYAGGGVISSNAAEELRELAEKRKIPVTTTLMGMGGFPGNSYLSLGMLGMHGTRYANYAIGECDLLIAVGVRFDDRVTGKIDTFAPHARVIHIDIDAAEIGKNVEVEVPIVGQVKEVLAAINQRLEAIELEELGEWHETIDRWKEEYPLRYGDSSEGRIMPQHVVEEVYSLTQGEAIICTEVGQNQMWAAQYYQYKYPRSFLSSGGLGTMGYGFPAAIGAKIACPELPVIDIAGDGSIQMNIQELGTAVQYRLPIIICILNNHFLGMVRQWQGLFYGGRYSYTDMSHQPDFVKIAEAYGAIGRRIKEASQVREALEEALKVQDRPVILDFWVEREADVYPMVPPGGSLMNMLGGD
ncbi:MAG: biosynthetic-type acetolactate synthase large subunit [Syntrophomonas sp.]|uniref:biosynthetic-type acetolactate synthase large subunit n=1 Tax=Syntrophomonas sp. TaxID=2053627 RepID=UPI00261595B3|nr:biosynthetic-type acetolactate synthase large subunit [Syntrophomonas sp.]MDD2510804.1 biosynthetic-type acetolactate synthase large subunit [Syntrophomonas sp.]MDD4626418.1 biosynthetic-type acetolactate synthase large subunit [Syntrophomonas sp.]